MKDLGQIISEIISEGVYQGMLRYSATPAIIPATPATDFFAIASGTGGALPRLSSATPATVIPATLATDLPATTATVIPATTATVIPADSPKPTVSHDMGGAVPRKTRKKDTVKETPVVEEVVVEAEEVEAAPEEVVVEAAPTDHAAFMGRVFAVVQHYKDGPEAGAKVAMALIRSKFGLEKFKLAKPEQFVAILTALAEAI